AREAKGRGPHPILQVTNALARSVTTWADRNEAGIGSNLVYAAIHQFGGNAGRSHQVEIPARRYLPFDENGQLAAGARQSILEVFLTALSRNR
ncbi:TPA: phage virion morphogenesis protein, partial [Pseudomonas aeruginosa]